MVQFGEARGMSYVGETTCIMVQFGEARGMSYVGALLYSQS